MLWLWGFKSSVWTFETTNDATNAFKNIKQLIETCLKASCIDSKQGWALRMNFETLCLRGSRSLCVGRSAQVGRAPCKFTLLNWPAWVALPRWVARPLRGSLGPTTLSTQLKTLKSALQFAKHDLGAMDLWKWNLFGFYTCHKYLHNQILFQI